MAAAALAGDAADPGHVARSSTWRRTSRRRPAAHRRRARAGGGGSRRLTRQWATSRSIRARRSATSTSRCPTSSAPSASTSTCSAFTSRRATAPTRSSSSAGDYHHDLGLNTWQSKGGCPPPPGTTGLFHFAILVPTRRRLAEVFVRLRDAGVPLQRRLRPPRERGALPARPRRQRDRDLLGPRPVDLAARERRDRDGDAAARPRVAARRARAPSRLG